MKFLVQDSTINLLHLLLGKVITKQVEEDSCAMKTITFEVILTKPVSKVKRELMMTQHGRETCH